ncbi:MAG: hypothetical protein Q7U07_08420 [Gammaproteobacteria bacterium]|nr:hypothetical protein [Gammaproteobacteria bacterium]
MAHSRHLLFVSLALAALLSAGCAATARLYSGPELPRDQVAVIEANPMMHDFTARGALFGSVDGAHVRGTVLRIDVLPGTHTVEVQCSFRIKPTLLGTDFDPLTPITRHSIMRQSRVPLTVQVEAGHTYQLDVEFTREQTCKPLLKDITVR